MQWIEKKRERETDGVKEEEYCKQKSEYDSKGNEIKTNSVLYRTFRCFSNFTNIVQWQSSDSKHFTYEMKIIKKMKMK